MCIIATGIMGHQALEVAAELEKDGSRIGGIDLHRIKPINKDKITLYTCGPTVYNYAHIGNFRAYIFEDLLRRTLEYSGYNVFQVMNN